MSNDEYTETIESPEGPVLTEKDQADLEKLLADPPAEEYHTVLKKWVEVLKEENLTGSAQEITAHWATAVVSKYVGLTFADMPAHRDAYFDLLREMRGIVEDEIAIIHEDERTVPTNEDEDAEANREHYLNILMQWQLSFLQHELEWDCTAADAATQLSALAEAHGLFFSATGLTGHLEAIRLEMTEDDQTDLAQALEEFRQSYVKGDNPEEVEGE